MIIKIDDDDNNNNKNDSNNNTTNNNTNEINTPPPHLNILCGSERGYCAFRGSSIEI